jgi:hypothetical protein
MTAPTMEEMRSIVEDGVDAEPETDPVLRVECIGDLQDLKISKAQNGASYDVTWEIPLDAFTELADSGDGHTVTFKQIAVGDGATVRRMSITRDADNNRRGKVVVRFSASEIKQGAGRLATLIANDETHGKLVFEPMQPTLDLRTRAE